jgi:O-antigen ligase
MATPSSTFTALVVRAALAAAVAVAFLFYGPAGDPRQPLRALGVGLIAAVLLLVISGSNRGADRRSWIAAGLLLAMAVALGVSAVANGPTSAIWGVHGRFDGLVGWAVLVVVGIAGWFVAGAEIRWLGRAAAVAGMAQAMLVFYQASQGSVPAGSNGNQVMTGGWLAVCIALALASALVERAPLKWWLLAAGALGTVALGVIGSRGAWVGLVVAVVFLLWTRPQDRRIALTISGIGIALVVSGALLAGGESIAKLQPANLFSASASARTGIWQGTLALIGDRPLLGAGPGRFLYVFPAYEPVEHARVEGADVRADQAHNHLLQMTAQAGIAAGAALLGLAGLIGLAVLDGVRRKDAAVLVAGAGFAAYVGQGLFGINAIEIDVLGWLLGGMILGRTVIGAGTDGISLRPLRVAGAIAALVLAVACGFYLGADIAYGRGLDAFAAGDLREASTLHEQAVAANPRIDLYRVALADDASYLGAGELVSAIDVIDVGLVTEPESYDLALARARALALLDGDRQEIADAYVHAAGLYPLGVTVRYEAMPVLVQAGRVDEAVSMARDVLAVVPDDTLASGILERSAR